MAKIKFAPLLILILTQSVFAAQCRDLFSTVKVHSSLELTTVYKKQSTNTIAEEIVKKIANEETNHERYINSQTNQEIDFIKDTEQIIFFSHWDIKSIAENGLQNLYQTKKTAGWNRPQARALVENSMLNVDLPINADNKLTALRPKYGFLNILNPAIKFNERMYSSLNSYGSVGAVLKNEVKKRSLWSIGDSFASDMFNNPEVPRKVQLSQFGTFNRKTIPKEVKFNEAYVETQILGEIKIEDIDHFIIKDIEVEDVFRTEEIKSYFKKLNIPVYVAERQHDNYDRFRYVKKERLF